MADMIDTRDMEEAEKQKAALYRLGAGLIRLRLPITIIVALLTGFMAYKALQLEMFTSVNNLLPYQHPWVQVHFRFAEQFGGANNINVMLRVKQGDVFTKEILTKIYQMTQAMDRVVGVNHDQISSIGPSDNPLLDCLWGNDCLPARHASAS